MIAIDTNILIRFLEQDDNAAQTAAARDLVRREGTVFINPIVMVELVWVLRSTFELDRSSIYSRLKRLIAAPEFCVPFPDATERAVTQYGKDRPILPIARWVNSIWHWVAFPP
jgi:predicted nucleic-acid-binding protein